MLAVENDDDLAALVLDVFRQRYQLWRCTNGALSCLHESSALLAVGDHGLRIPAITNRAVDLDASLKHIVYGSGLVSTTFKIAAIWARKLCQNSLNGLHTAVHVSLVTTRLNAGSDEMLKTLGAYIPNCKTI